MQMTFMAGRLESNFEVTSRMFGNSSRPAPRHSAQLYSCSNRTNYPVPAVRISKDIASSSSCEFEAANICIVNNVEPLDIKYSCQSSVRTSEFQCSTYADGHIGGSRQSSDWNSAERQNSHTIQNTSVLPTASAFLPPIQLSRAVFVLLFAVLSAVVGPFPALALFSRNDSLTRAGHRRHHRRRAGGKHFLPFTHLLSWLKGGDKAQLTASGRASGAGPPSDAYTFDLNLGPIGKIATEVNRHLKAVFSAAQEVTTEASKSFDGVTDTVAYHTRFGTFAISENTQPFAAWHQQTLEAHEGHISGAMMNTKEAK